MVLNATDNILQCKECGYETKAERVAFKISELDGKTKCNGCKRMLSVKNWLCPCKVIWYKCDKHARAGDVFRRIKDKTKARNATAKTSGPSIFQQVQKEIRCQDPEHILHPRRHKEDKVTLQGLGRRDQTGKPFSLNMLSTGLKRKFPHLCGNVPRATDSQHIQGGDDDNSNSTRVPISFVQLQV